MMPSPLVITRFPGFVKETATNFFCPACPPHATEVHAMSEADVRVTQKVPGCRGGGEVEGVTEMEGVLELDGELEGVPELEGV